VALAGVALLAIDAGRISHTIRADYREFVHLAPTPGSARFLSGGGNRYDYWRVAWKEFRSEPLRGVGAGNYQIDYYQHRRTTEAITQPHSIELQTLAELGAVGAALLLAFVVLVAVGIVRIARLAREDRGLRFVAVAGAGGFIGWLAQTSADWEHLIPGLTFIALGAAAAMLALTGKPVRALVGRTHMVALAAVTVLAGVGAVLIAPRILSLHDQSSAQSALARHDPRGAIRDATRALDYDGDSVPALVLRSAAFARFDAFDLARADLRRALTVEPQNWVTWALMGDLLTRRGDPGAARASYRRAHQLDPLEPGLVEPR
jgi:Flp pilus assembly protein TadD